VWGREESVEAKITVGIDNISWCQESAAGRCAWLEFICFHSHDHGELTRCRAVSCAFFARTPLSKKKDVSKCCPDMLCKSSSS
jgi:hypothetical protein